MSCFACKKQCEPWLLLINEGFRVDEDGKNIGDTIQVCSYSCCMNIQYILPKPYKHLILNQEDFCWLRPIVPKNKEFTYLTNSEIMLLTEDEKSNYYNEADEQLEFNTEKKDILDELESEDKNTYNIENNYSSDGILDDY
jgi:hypothetical protein